MNNDSTFRTIITILGLLAILGAMAIGACDVPEAKAKRVLHGAGYTDVDIGGHAWFSCGEDDSLASTFTATGPSGRHVEGAVCCGWAVKDCTIRSE